MVSQGQGRGKRSQKVVDFNMFDEISNIKKSAKIPKTLFKPKSYMRVSDGLRQATNMNSFERGSCFSFIGKSDTGKTTEALSVCINGINDKKAIPVFIDLEGKLSFARWKMMGARVDYVYYDLETGEIIPDEEISEYAPDEYGIDYQGDFIYMNKTMIMEWLFEFKKIELSYESEVSAEHVSYFMQHLFREQVKLAKRGRVVSYLFIIDSYDRMNTMRQNKGSSGTKNELHTDSTSDKSNNQSNVQFKNNYLEIINDSCIKPTKMAKYPFYNDLILIVNAYDVTAGNLTTIKATGGHKRKHIMDYEIYYGGKAGEGAKLVKVKNNKFSIGRQAKVEIMKGHGTGQNDDKEFKMFKFGEVISTAHGTIAATPEAIKQYVKDHPELFGETSEYEDLDITYEDQKVDDKASKEEENE